MPHPTAILLDLDDTILAFDAMADESWRRAIALHRDRLGSATPDAVFHAVRASGRAYWADAARHQLGRMNLRRADSTSSLRHSHNAGFAIPIWPSSWDATTTTSAPRRCTSFRELAKRSQHGRPKGFGWPF